MRRRLNRPALLPLPGAALAAPAGAVLAALLGAVLGCAHADAPGVGSRGDAGPPSLEDEAGELCRLRVDLTEEDQRAQARREELEARRLASGTFAPDEMAARFGRLHAEAYGRCLDHVISALEGPGGERALRILRDARTACEASSEGVTRGLAVRCIHARKLELFTKTTPQDDAAARETLDRLLRVGDGAPLSESQRADYCRSRELGGTGHPLCR